MKLSLYTMYICTYRFVYIHVHTDCNNIHVHVQVNVNVHLSPNRLDRAKVITMAALAESARQLAESAANLGGREEVKLLQSIIPCTLQVYACLHFHIIMYIRVQYMFINV